MIVFSVTKSGDVDWSFRIFAREVGPRWPGLLAGPGPLGSGSVCLKRFPGPGGPGTAPVGLFLRDVGWSSTWPSARTAPAGQFCSLFEGCRLVIAWPSARDRACGAV